MPALNTQYIRLNLANNPTVSGTLIQLNLKGALDYILYGLNGKKVSFWWKRHTAVSSFAVDQSFQTSTNGGIAGRTIEFVKERAADLAKNDFGRAVFPGIGVKDPDDPTLILTTDVDSGDIADLKEPYFSKNAGYQLYEQLTLTVGSQPMQQHVWWSNQIGLDLRTPAGRRIYEMVGGWDDIYTRIRRSRQPQIFYTPFLFYYTIETSTPLRLISCAFHSVKTTLTLRGIKDLIAFPATSPFTVNDVYVRLPYVPTLVVDPEINSVSLYLGDKVQNSDIEVTMLTEYVYLEQAERLHMANTPMCDIMEQHTACEITYTQSVATGRYGSTQEFSQDMHFNVPIKEFWFQVAREADEAANQRGNFDGVYDPVTGEQQDPIAYLAIQLNSNLKILADPIYFRLVQPYQYHTHLPTGYFYVYSAAIDPENLKATGTIPAGKLDSLQILMGLRGTLFTENSTQVYVRICAVGINLVCYSSGLATKAFLS